MNHASLPLKVGIVLGLLFFAHALIPNSNAWPLVWPLIAGSLVVVLAAREERVGSFGQGIGVAVKAGATAGLLFFVATAAALWLLSSRALEPVARGLGAEGEISLSPAILAALAIAALIGTGLAALSGAATYPIARRLN